MSEENAAVPADEEPRHVLVLPDRDAAEEAATELAARFGLREEPQLVRDASPARTTPRTPSGCWS